MKNNHAFRMIASRAYALAAIAVLAFSFATSALATGESATMGSVQNVTSSSATLNGSYLITQGVTTDYIIWFELDTDSGFGAPGQTDAFVPGALNGPFTATASLEPSTTYYFRACITNINEGHRTCSTPSAPYESLAAAEPSPIEEPGGNIGDNSAGSGSNTGGSSGSGSNTGSSSGSGSNTGSSAGSGSNTGDGSSGSGSNTGGSGSGANTITEDQKLQNPLASVNTIPEFIAKLLTILFKIAVPVLVCVFIWIGFLFIKAQGDEKELTAAKNALLWAVIGAALILGSWVLAEALSGTIDQLR